MTLFWVEPTGRAPDVATAAAEAGADALVGDDTAPGGPAPLRRTPDGLAGEGLAARTVRIAGPADQATARGLLGRVDALLVETDDWRVIPLENLIAWSAGTGTRIVAVVSGVGEAALAAHTLERGVDGVLLRTDDPGAVAAVARILATMGRERVPLVEAEVLSIEPVRIGDRVCVDTVAMLTPEEGLLVGSGAGFLFLVASEAAESGFVAARPFRVNAGAVHAYVQTPGGATRYLAELRAGVEVLVVRPDGSADAVTVGRCKIERRPMLLVRARRGDREGSIVVQNAETVRLATSKGPTSVSALSAGDAVLVHLGSPARHFGVPVDERIREV